MRVTLLMLASLVRMLGKVLAGAPRPMARGGGPVLFPALLAWGSEEVVAKLRRLSVGLLWRKADLDADRFVRLEIVNPCPALSLGGGRHPVRGGGVIFLIS